MGGNQSPLDTPASRFCNDISILKRIKTSRTLAKKTLVNFNKKSICILLKATFNDGTAEEVLATLTGENVIVEAGRFRVAN